MGSILVPKSLPRGAQDLPRGSQKVPKRYPEGLRYVRIGSDALGYARIY